MDNPTFYSKLRSNFRPGIVTMDTSGVSSGVEVYLENCDRFLKLRLPPASVRKAAICSDMSADFYQTARRHIPQNNKLPLWKMSAQPGLREPHRAVAQFFKDYWYLHQAFFFFNKKPVGYLNPKTFVNEMGWACGAYG